MNSTIIIVISLLTISFIYDFIISLLNFKYRKNPIPEVVKDVYDEKRYNTFLNYSKELYRVKIISKLVYLFITLVIIITNGFALIEEITINITSNIHLQTILFLVIYYSVFYLISIGFDYYQNFSIEERFGFNKSTKKLFAKDQIIEISLTVIVGAVVVYFISILYSNVNSLFYIYAFVVFSILVVIFNIFFVILIMPLFYKQASIEEGELKEKITNLASKNGYGVKGIIIIDASKRSTKLNAYFSGFGKHKKVMLFDTLLDKLTTDEILSVVAHEIGHSKYKHMLYDLIQDIIKTAIYISLFALVVNTTIFNEAFGLTSNTLGFAMIIFVIILSPLHKVISAISNTISRKHEVQADKYVEKLGLKVPFINALKKVGKENLGNLNPHPVFVALKYNHPPLVDRINYL